MTKHDLALFKAMCNVTLEALRKAQVVPIVSVRPQVIALLTEGVPSAAFTDISRRASRINAYGFESGRECGLMLVAVCRASAFLLSDYRALRQRDLAYYADSLLRYAPQSASTNELVRLRHSTDRGAQHG